MRRGGPLLSESLEGRRLFATIAWDGGAHTTNWGDAQNWAGDVVPTAADTVDITNAYVDIRNGESFSVASFVTVVNILDSRLSIHAGGTLHVVGGVFGAKRLELDGGTFITDGESVFLDRQVLSWSSGTIAGTGSVKVYETLELPTPATGVRTLTSTINFSGDNLTISGTIYLGDDTSSGLFRLYSGAAFESGGFLAGGAAGGVVELDNGVSKVGSGTFTVGEGVLLAAHDALIIKGGLLDVDRIDSRVTQDTGFELVIAFLQGEMRVHSGQMVGGTIKTDDFQLTGTFEIAGSIDMSTVIVRNNVNITGGTVTGTGLVFANYIGKWSGTNIPPNGVVRIATGGAPVFDTTDLPKIGGTLEVGAAFTITTLRLTDADGNPGAINNYDVLNLNSASQIVTPDLVPGGVVTIANTGTINVNAGAADPTAVATLSEDVNVISQNPGIVNVLGGTLTIGRAPGTHTDAIEGGTWSVATGATLVLPDSIRINRAKIVLATGSTIDGFANLNRNEGTLSLPPGNTFSVAPVGGTLENAGNITLGDSTTFVVDGTLSNTKTLTVGAGNVVADRLINTVGGTVSVAFVVTRTTPIFAIQHSAAIDGTLAITGSVTSVAATDSRRLIGISDLAGSGVSGAFRTFTQPTNQTGRKLLLRYEPSAVTIVVLPASPGTPALTAQTDTGIDSTDAITRASSLTITVSSIETGTIELWLDGALYGTVSRNAGVAASFTVASISEGTHTAFARYTDPDGDVSVSSTRTIIVDRTSPIVTAITYSYEQRPEFAITFSETAYNYMFSSISIVPTAGGSAFKATYNLSRSTWTFPTTAPLADGDYTATFASTGTDRAGNQVIGRSDSFFALAGDANRDRAVDFNDLLTLARNYGSSTATAFSQGNFDYQGGVTFSDLLILARQYGKTIPPAPQAMPPPATPNRPIGNRVARHQSAVSSVLD